LGIFHAGAFLSRGPTHIVDIGGLAFYGPAGLGRCALSGAAEPFFPETMDALP
jgi:hypothetical protein